VLTRTDGGAADAEGGLRVVCQTAAPDRHAPGDSCRRGGPVGDHVYAFALEIRGAGLNAGRTKGRGAVISCGIGL